MLTKEQKIWKGENYSAKNGISWLFRQLVTELDPNNPRSKPSYNEVKRVVQRSKTLDNRATIVWDFSRKSSRTVLSPIAWKFSGLQRTCT